MNKRVLFKTPPEYVYIFYSNRQLIYDHLFSTGVVTKMFNEVPNYENLKKLLYPHKNSTGSLIVLDDCLQDLSNVIQTIFTELSHHLKVSCLLLSQNLFFQNRIYRNLSLNCHILIVFMTPRDMTQVATLSRQISPESPQFLIQSFLDATKYGYGYICMDFCQETNDLIRFKTKILPNELPVVVYVKKK